MPFIYHITPREDWLSARQAGEYRAASLNTEGFIHCSTENQVAAVANAFYPKQRGLLLLVIDSARLRAPLRWEAPANPSSPQAAPVAPQGMFPHIYGALNPDAVVDIYEFEPNTEGVFVFPAP